MKTNLLCIRGAWGSLFAKLFLATILVATYSCSNETIEEEGLVETDQETNLAARVSSLEGKTYYIKSVHSGKYLDVSGKSNSNNANIHQWTYTGATNQQWEVISVGSNKVRFKGVDSGKSLDIASSNKSNGGNVVQTAYGGDDSQEWEIFSAGSGQYYILNSNSGRALDVAGWSKNNGGNVHQWAYRGQNNQKWTFTQVGGSTPTTPPTTPPTGGGGTASSIIGGGWKLNGFSGSLNVGSSNNGLSYADNASKGESHFFFEKNGYAAFRTYPGNPTSGGSSNPRTELRELINGGSNYWNGNNNTEHSMKWRFRIEDLPPSGKLAFGQIHERDDNFDDIIRVQVQGSSGQNSGSVDLRILGYVTEEIEGSGRTVNFNMQMDTEYYFELAMRNGVVSLYNLNNNGGRASTLFRSVDIGNANECYFKAGCYLQSTSSSHRSSNVYGQVLIKNLTVNPDN